MTYADWATRHAVIFGFQTDAEAQMLAAWCGLFERMGFAPEELAEATDYIAMYAPPRFRADHLAALQERVRDQRGKEIRRRPEIEEDPRGTCAVCGGTGWVTVPHWKTVRGITPRWYTMAVICTCPKGEWLAGKTRPGTLTLHAYQGEGWTTRTPEEGTVHHEPIPLWRDLMKQHDADLKRQHLAEAEAAQLRKQAGLIDAALGRLTKRGVTDG